MWYLSLDQLDFWINPVEGGIFICRYDSKSSESPWETGRGTAVFQKRGAAEMDTPEAALDKRGPDRRRPYFCAKNYWACLALKRGIVASVGGVAFPCPSQSCPAFEEAGKLPTRTPQIPISLYRRRRSNFQRQRTSCHLGVICRVCVCVRARLALKAVTQN